MKRIISTILVCVLLLGTVLTLASCGGGIDNGTYVSDIGVIKISGSELTMTQGTTSWTYTYEIKTDELDSSKQKIFLEDANGETFDYYYEKYDDGFKFAGTKYTKR